MENKITWDDITPVNLTEALTDTYARLKQCVERYNDPSWKQKQVYFISPHVASLFQQGLIDERLIPLYAFESRTIWVKQGD